MIRLDRRHGGVALVIGYVILVAILFRDPARGLAAIDGLRDVLYFVVLPALGVASGVAAISAIPYSGVGLFVTGSYLALVGLTLAMGFVSTSLLVSLLGLALFGLAVFGTVVALTGFYRYVTTAR